MKNGNGSKFSFLSDHYFDTQEDVAENLLLLGKGNAFWKLSVINLFSEFIKSSYPL